MGPLAGIRIIELGGIDPGPLGIAIHGHLMISRKGHARFQNLGLLSCFPGEAAAVMGAFFGT